MAPTSVPAILRRQSSTQGQDFSRSQPRRKQDTATGASWLHKALWEYIASLNRTPIEHVEHLLIAGAPPNGPNHRGETPLLCACRRPNPELAELLLRYGADPNKGNCNLSMRPIHTGMRTCGLWPHISRQRPAFNRIITALIKYGADLDAELPREGYYPSTLLEDAVCYGDIELVNQLLAVGASATGDALHWVYRSAERSDKRSAECAIALLKAGAWSKIRWEERFSGLELQQILQEERWQRRKHAMMVLPHMQQIEVGCMRHIVSFL